MESGKGGRYLGILWGLVLRLHQRPPDLPLIPPAAYELIGLRVPLRQLGGHKKDDLKTTGFFFDGGIFYCPSALRHIGPC